MVERVLHLATNNSPYPVEASSCPPAARFHHFCHLELVKINNYGTGRFLYHFPARPFNLRVLQSILKRFTIMCSVTVCVTAINSYCGLGWVKYGRVSLYGLGHDAVERVGRLHKYTFDSPLGDRESRK